MSGGDWDLPYFDLTAHGLRVLKMDDICRLLMEESRAMDVCKEISHFSNSTRQSFPLISVS